MNIVFALGGILLSLLSVTLFSGLTIQLCIIVGAVALYLTILATQRSKWLYPFVFGFGLGIDLFGTYRLGIGLTYAVFLLATGEAAARYLQFTSEYWRFCISLICCTFVLLLILLPISDLLSGLKLSAPVMVISALWAYSAHSAHIRASRSLL